MVVIRMPLTVNLMSTKIRVKRVPKIDISETHGPGAEAYGIFSDEEMRIEIADGQAPDRERVTYVHENLHAMLAASGLDKTTGGELDEEIATRLSPVLLSWLRDNPRVITWLRERA